ncbi:PLP-dependent aminotransferase family protein [Musicola paradisiaca]|uniref:Transcriptional regulator, GntR family with aminotransferase domain n=1 Tax=Musicola paradisiaca (strain Ech703) TaxID=579405 RepID=C6C519_MUSP7|nr:PLP-dependent aminotransferase family protein [Musicola paradisiaca]ACS85629.1 transcriptional regulator, GntR family with aminotransferase domain [Musicola paradisiaca Ech703]
MGLLDTTSTQPLVRQIVDRIAGQITKRQLAPGTRLPSIRQQAQFFNVSVMTVTNAYSRLVAEGFLVAQAGRGYFVSDTLPRGVVEPEPGIDVKVDRLWLIQRAYEENNALLKAGCGWIHPQWLYGDGMRQALTRLARNKTHNLTQYSSPQGLLPLRQQLEQVLARRAIHVPARQIMTTSGATQALILLVHCLTRAGDTVFVDSPGNSTFFIQLRAFGLNLVGARRSPDGYDLVELEQQLRQHRPKLFFTTSQLHNPTGSSLHPRVSARLLQLAQTYDFTLVDNDVMAGLTPSGLTTLASQDQLRRVCYIGSFSKTLSPELRAGFIACDEALNEKLMLYKMIHGLTTSELTETLLWSMLTEKGWNLHLKGLAARLAEAQNAVCDRLEGIGLRLFHRPEGGPFLWACLPKAVDLMAMTRTAAEHGILLAPGHLFHVEPCQEPWLRFNVSYCHRPEVYDFLSRYMNGDLH